MDSFKPAWVFLCASAALHAAVGFFAVSPWTNVPSKSTEPIQIDYVRYEKTPASALAVEKPRPKQEPAAKKNQGSPVPKMISKTAPALKAAPSDFQKFIEGKLRKQELELARLAYEKPSPERSTTKTSSEILADPKKGKIFVSYFGEVKKKIQKTLLDRYADRYSGRGRVTLAFVLNVHGQVERVIVR